MKGLDDLIEISRFYGANKDFVIAGGGNTSYKNDTTLWVKASGTTLGTISIEGFAELDRQKLSVLSTKKYSDQNDIRENEVKSDLFRASIYPEKNLRPSVETSMHNAIRYAYVVHTHPTLVNALLCSEQAQALSEELFGGQALYIPYTDPGYILFKAVESGLEAFRKANGAEPQIILLENHGIFVSADTIEEVKDLYAGVMDVLENRIQIQPDTTLLPLDNKLALIMPALRMLLSGEGVAKIAIARNSQLIQKFCQNAESFAKAALPFTPDIIVYCKARPLYIDSTGSVDEIIEEFTKKLETYRASYGYDSKIVLLKGMALIGIEDNYRSAEIALEVYEDLLKISTLSENFGGPHFMNEREIAFIDNWEVENYRRSVSKGKGLNGRVENKIAIVTGGAQGFGAGIAESLFSENANVVIADLNETVGAEMATKLNTQAKKNRALFVKADVSDPASVEQLIAETAKAFGGLDIFISNAGILRAGGLDEMTPESFTLMTKVNYTGYFLCAKYASAVMKQQGKFKKGYFSDIIQINSKSGLKGSNKNFAYAGGKFGGIGLTQSFAMELMPFGIKVNSICPGNFFDGPLWSDPEKGLFVQYLKAGKVPGAKCIEDVKKFYEAQVPANRGCTPTDVMKAVFYIVEQEYETGQAVPVTGGQNMLN